MVEPVKPKVITQKQFHEIDIDGDGTISSAEDAAFKETHKINDSTKIQYGTDKKVYDNWEEFKKAHLREIIDKASQPKPGESLDLRTSKAIADYQNEQIKLNQLRQQLENLKEQIGGKRATEAQEREMKSLEDRILLMEKRVKSSLKLAENIARVADRMAEMKPEWYKNAGLNAPPEAGKKPVATANIPLRASQAGGNPAGQANKTAGGGFQPPASWGKGIQGPTSDFALSSIMQSMNLNALDSAMKATSEGDRLMMLFYYFARMAESGDMGAIYQFMKFITYVISKDKAKQQIELGKKLLDLQSESRKATEELMKTDSSASSDEFSKAMMMTKEKTDANATSQKLIAQMMEEMAQVVETLTNSTSSALQAQGRILRKVSSAS